MLACLEDAGSDTADWQTSERCPVGFGPESAASEAPKQRIHTGSSCGYARLRCVKGEVRATGLARRPPCGTCGSWGPPLPQPGRPSLTVGL